MKQSHFRLYLFGLNLRKVWNLALVFSSFYLSKLFKHPIHWGMPISISLEPTTSCNLRCPECPSGLRSFTRPTGMLQQDLFKDTIDQLAPTLSMLTFYFQGEPYLNPNFLELVKYANSKKIITNTSTNAHYLNDEKARLTVESGLKRLIISIDGTTQESYQSYRVGGKLEKVIQGTKNIVKWKKELNSPYPKVIFQFLVVKPNEHQIEEVLELGKELEVDEVTLKTAQIYDYENGSPLIPDNEKYARYRRNPDGTYSIKNKLANHCWKMWQSCVITWDGKIVPCCFDKDAHHQLGTVADESFIDIWRGKPYQAFRKAILTNRKGIDICQNCTEGLKIFTEE